jgi:hypothetical protein
LLSLESRIIFLAAEPHLNMYTFFLKFCNTYAIGKLLQQHFFPARSRIYRDAAPQKRCPATATSFISKRPIFIVYCGNFVRKRDKIA